MRRLIDQIWASELIKGMGVFFIGSMIVNLGAFVYHVIMARFLGPIEYGILGSLIGLTYFASIPIGALDILVTKGISSLGDEDLVSGSKSFLAYLFSRLNIWLVVLAVILLVSTGYVTRFLHLDQWSGVMLVWVMVYGLIFSTVGLATLRALLLFKQVVINQVLSMFLRLVISAIIVFTISRTYLGAQWGVVISMLAGLGILLYQSKFIFAAPFSRAKLKFNLRNLGLASLFFSGAFTSMYSLDVVLVKHFLPDYWAGIYASLATGGKVVFFALAPIAVVLLPVVSRKVVKKLSVRSDLFTILAVSFMIGGGIVVGYFLFSPTVVNILFTNRFLDAAVYLPWFGLAMLGYSLAIILGSFLLALNKMKVVGIALAGLVLELILISLFNANLWQVVWGLMIVFWSLAIVLFSYCLYATQREN